MVSSERVQNAGCTAHVLRLEDVFRNHSQYVAAIGIRLLGRDNDIDDFLQDVFIEAADGLKELREPNAVRGWLATLAVRKARRIIRKRMLRRRIFGSGKDETAPAISHAASHGALSAPAMLRGSRDPERKSKTCVDPASH